MASGTEELLSMMLRAAQKKEVVREMSELADVLRNPLVHQVLLESLRDERYLGSAGQMLQELVLDGNDEQRKRAASLVKELSQEADFDVGVLKGGLSDPDEDVRRFVSWAIRRICGRIPVEDAKLELIDSLADQNEKVRENCRHALGNCHEIVGALNEKLRDINGIRRPDNSQRRQRMEVTKVLGELAKKGQDISTAVPEIEEGIWDLNSSDRRHHSLVALKYALINGTQGARRGVEVMLKDSSWGHIAGDALAQSAKKGDEESLKALVGNLRSVDQRTRNNAVRGLVAYLKEGGRLDLDEVTKSIRMSVCLEREGEKAAAERYGRIISSIKRKRMEVPRLRKIR